MSVDADLEASAHLFIARCRTRADDLICAAMTNAGAATVAIAVQPFERTFALASVPGQFRFARQIHLRLLCAGDLGCSPVVTGLFVGPPFM